VAPCTIGDENIKELAEAVSLKAWYGRNTSEFPSVSDYLKQEIRPNLNDSQRPIILVYVKLPNRSEYYVAEGNDNIEGIWENLSGTLTLWVGK
jgi:hypothetical protein